MNYWPGNAAKTKIITLVLEQIQRTPGRPVTIFDYGCGVCAQWPRILRDHPSFKLLGFDPNPGHVAKAKVNLAGQNATLLEVSSLETTEFQADYIVSFSVLEHVYDRASYLAIARRHLAPEGRFYLNYDDGHFRGRLDLSAPGSWPSRFRGLLGGWLMEWRGKRGTAKNYKRRVTSAEINSLLAQSGFRTVDSFYSNLSDLKGLFKTVPAEKRDEFIEFWNEIERRLNRDFTQSTVEKYGDTTNLGHFMSSRTLVLMR